MRAIIISLLAIILFYSCSHKMQPAAQSTAVKEVKPTTTTTTVKTVTTTTTPKTESAEVVTGKGIYTTKCTRCHEAKPLADWTAQQWVPIINRMAPKARLDDTEKANVTAYVNFYAKNS